MRFATQMASSVSCFALLKLTEGMDSQSSQRLVLGKTHNLRIKPALLDTSFLREADAAPPFDRLSRNALCNDARPILYRGRLLDDAAPFFLSLCGIVLEKSRALEFVGMWGNDSWMQRRSE